MLPRGLDSGACARTEIENWRRIKAVVIEYLIACSECHEVMILEVSTELTGTDALLPKSLADPDWANQTDEKHHALDCRL